MGTQGHLHTLNVPAHTPRAALLCPLSPHLALGRADEGDIGPGLHTLHPLLLHGDSDGLVGGLCTHTEKGEPLSRLPSVHVPPSVTTTYR